MLLRKHNVLTLALGGILPFGPSACRRPADPAPAYWVPQELLISPEISAVPKGSLAVAADPPDQTAGLAGVILLRLFAEPGAQIRYSYDPFARDTPTQDLSSYQAPILLSLPVTIWTQADVSGQRGEVFAFHYASDPALVTFGAPIFATRLPKVDLALAPLADLPPSISFAASATHGGLTGTPVIDGRAIDWSAHGALASMGRPHQTPVGMESVNLTWAESGEDDLYIYVVLGLAGAPCRRAGCIYGFELGPSNVTFASFGNGATYDYRIESNADGLWLYSEGQDRPLPLLAPSESSTGDVVEFKIAKSSLPRIAGAQELALRPYAQDSSYGLAVGSRLEPWFLRSAFGLKRGIIQSPERDVWQLDFRSNPALGAAGLQSEYLGLGASVLPELRPMNQLPVGVSGTIPLFFVDRDEHGYAGLNTSDRGVLTTLGADSSLMAKAQLLAHELAHFQNARGSQLKDRWLQEGMSEWTAERFLYRHFPARAVHKFIKRLRFDRYFDGLENGALDELPLAKWGSEPSVLGYEKSLMFFDILEQKVGQEALIKALQRAINVAMDSRDLQNFLEKETGQDLSSLFAFWVFPGEPAAGLSPYELFTDKDGDGLTQLDELALGTSSETADSKGDGYLDGERYFWGVSTADKPSHVLHLAAGSQDTSAYLRLARLPGEEIQYSFNPFASSLQSTYKGPVLARPPYKVLASVGGESPVTLTRSLYVDGKQVVPELASQRILPPTPLHAENVRSDVEFTASFGRGTSSSDVVIDSSVDLPGPLGAYDLTGITATADAEAVTIKLSTRLPPEPNGDWGDYILTFNTAHWPSNGPTAQNPVRVEHLLAVTLSSGVAYIHDYTGDKVVTKTAAGALEWQAHASLSVSVSRQALQPWLDSNDQHLICARTNLDLSRGDQAACVWFDATGGGDSRVGAKATDAFGLGKTALEVFVNAATVPTTRAKALATLGLSALREFEFATGRPSLERTSWSLHANYLAAGSATTGSADPTLGAYLAADAAYDGTPFNYLAVEQLARLQMADMLNALDASAPFWVQEAYVQWLTASAMYKLYPTSEVHAFHAARIADYLCFVQATNPPCPQRFSSDMALADWNQATLLSTGSVKTLIFTLELDAILGAEALSKVFGTFANFVPDAAALKELCKGYAPAKATQIDQLWVWFVDGNSAANITATLLPKLDGLYKFERDKLQSLGVDTSTYLQ